MTRRIARWSLAVLGLLLLARPSPSADPNAAAAFTCAIDDGVTCTVQGHHDLPNGTVLDYGDRHVVLEGHLVLAGGPGPRLLTLRTNGDLRIAPEGRIGTEPQGRYGRDGGDLVLEVGGALTLHGHLDLDGQPDHGTGGHLTLTTGGPLTITSTGAILADAKTGGSLSLAVGGDLQVAGRLKARGDPHHGQGGAISLTVAGGATVSPPARLRVDGATAGTMTLTFQHALTLDGDLTADGRTGGALTLQAQGPVSLGPDAHLGVEGQGPHGRAGAIAGEFCGASAIIAGRLRAVGEKGADGGTIEVRSRGPLLLSGRLRAQGEGRGAQGGTIRVAATAGLAFGPHARLDAEGHPDGAIVLASPDPLDTGHARIEPPFTRVALGAICGLSPLNVPRAHHSASLLRDGSVLLAGGRNGGYPLGGPVGSLERFDPNTGAFTLLAPQLSPPREGHTATLLPDGLALFLGGRNGSGTPLALAEKLDLATGTLAPVSTEPALGRAGHTATLLLDGTVLVAGGTDAAGAVLRSAFIFNPSAGTVSGLGSPLSTPRAGHTATPLPDGRVLITGGRDGSGAALASAELYDPAMQAFSPLPGTLATPRSGHTSTLLPDGSVLVLGGTADGATSLAGGERFDPATGQFAPAPIGLLRARRAHTATLLGDASLLVTGGFGSGPLPTAERLGLGLVDATPPSVVAVRPPDQATGVAVEDRVGVRFSEPINPVTLSPDSFRLIDESTNRPLDGSLAISEGALLGFFVPTAPLQEGTTYTVNLTAGIRDTAGHPLVPFASTFTTKAAAPITLTPGTLTLRIGQTAPLTITLPTPAPAGGTVVTVTSGAPAAVGVTPSVPIPAGQAQGQASVTGLAEVTTNLTATAPGFQPGMALVTVVPPPSLTGFTPTSGEAGTAVTLTGTKLTGASTVTFNGTPAAFTVTSDAQIRATVPTGATTGPLAVTTPGGTATSTGSFVVTPTWDFALTLAPSQGSLIQGSSVSYQVKATGIGGFTGLITPGIGPLPSGVTAELASPTLTAGQSTFLTLTASGAAQPGGATFTVTGTSPLKGSPVARTAQGSLQVLGSGVTALVGQVRDTEDRPLPNVAIRVGGFSGPSVSTDQAGGFLFLNPPTGAQVVLVDGSPASTPAASYPTIPVTVTIAPGATNALGFTPRLHAQPVGRTIPLDPSQETVLTTPEIPGFEARVPQGVTITGWDGQPNTQIGARFVPADRSPLPPFPADQHSGGVYMFFFGKVGGGRPSQPVPITYPNDVGGLPGEKVELWFYNEAPDGTAPNRWEQYGTGTVSADGLKLVPDLDPATGRPFGIPRFCCGGGMVVLPPQPRPPSWADTDRGRYDPGRPHDGEPVEPATGLFVLEKTDLVLPGRLPLLVTRTYRTRGTSLGPFGIGTSWSYDLFLLPPPNGSPDQLVLFMPGNSRTPFARQPDGSFAAPGAPALRGARITIEPDGTRVLRWKDGSLWRFTSQGFLLSQGDRNGNRITITRDGSNRATQITEPAGRSLTIAYDTASRIARITDPLFRSVGYEYDPQGRLARVTDPAGGITTYAYDSQHRMVSITDPRGITFLTNEYDAQGRVSRQTQADGGVWTFQYTAFGDYIAQTVVTDPRGNRTTRRFNTSGYQVAVTDALGQTTTFERDPGTNLLLSTTDPLGRVTRFAYDQTGNVTSITDPAGNIRTFTYEPTFNKVTSITDPLGNVTRFDYDPSGRLLQRITEPLGFFTDIGYNPFGQVTAVTNHLGRAATISYSPRGEVERAADPLGNASQITYDAVSRVETIVDPRGNTTKLDYNALNGLVSIVNPQGGATAFTYDPNGNLLSLVDARGNAITYTYDAMNRMTRRTDPLGRSSVVTYYSNGMARSVQDRKNQTATFSYDALDRVVRTDYSDGSSVTRTYDAAGRLIELDDSADPYRPVRFEYDALDRLITESSARGSVSYRYDEIHRRTQMTVSGQAPVTYTYDGNSRLRTIRQEPFTPVTLGYNELNLRARLSLPNGVITEYGYDEANRLTGLTYRNASGILGTLTYQRDVAGHKTAVGGSFARTFLPEPVPTASYDPANRQLTFGGKTMTYDSNGNLETLTENGQVTRFTWDVRDRLVGITGPDLVASFTYGAGRRRSKMLNGRIIEALHDGADTTQEVVDGTPVNYLNGRAVDEPLLRAGEGYLADELGSTLALVDAAGALSTQYTYDPFGATTFSGPPSLNPFQFTGRDHDATGLYYYRARYYHPGLMRFVAEDPLGVRGGDVNLYAYAGNDPLDLTDPDGLALRDFVRGLGIGAAGAAVGIVVGSAIVAAAPVWGPPVVIGAAAVGLAATAYRAYTLFTSPSPNPAQRDRFLGEVVGGLAVGGAAARGVWSRGGAAEAGAEVGQGTKVYRVWGDGSGPNGPSWTTVDPRTVPNYRDVAGLPAQNTGRFASEGTIKDPTGVTTRSALPLEGNRGGLPEVIIPDPARQVQLERVSGANPEF